MIIGHHILHGKEQRMEKPFAVIEKVTTTDHNQTVDLDESNMERSQLGTTMVIENKTDFKTEYCVRAIVKKKLIFKTRPKPIVANIAKKV